jgi:hypothetical protein
MPLACFYAGSILDMFLRLLFLAHYLPSALGADFYYCSDTSYFSELPVLCKTFMDHFEKVTEMRLNDDYSISGAKIIDLLDCMVESDEPVTHYEYAATVNKKECHIKVNYRYVNLMYEYCYVRIRKSLDCI